LNLVTAREKVGDLRSRRWTSTDAQRVFRVSVVEPAIKQLASECPEAFIPDEETSIVYRDWTDVSLGRTLAATSDAYVLSLGLENLAGAEDIVVDGTWDAIYYLEIKRSDGTILRRRCRKFFLATDPFGIGTYYVSIDKVWPNASDTGMTFRLFQPYFYTRDDVTDVIDGRVFDENRQAIFSVPAGAVRFFQEEDYRGTGSGTPRRLSRWGHEQMPAPNRAPVALVPAQGDAWLGPEPPGAFRYCYTYVWGRRDDELVAPGGKKDPMLESAPSPVSNSVTVADMTRAVSVTNLVNIDYQQNFDPTPTALRNGHSGWRKRIYRARSSVNAGAGTEESIESPEHVYYFLVEVDGDDTTFQDNGTITPDYFRRLPESTGYFRWVLSPHADGKYTVDWRVYRRPGVLLADTDTPPVHPDFEDMLLTLYCKWAAMADKQPAEAAVYQTEFEDKMGKWREKDANPAAAIIPISWSMEGYGDWNRYTTSTP
jgi:hypothetical protein